MHLGPFAEDFYQAFGLGTDETTIGHLDIAGVSLAAAQALERRTRELQEQLDLKDQEIGQLRAELAALLQRVERLQAQQ
ncbi:MAG: hypothetical protein GTO22_21790 [Gemmatimonadales bacterium]|nr:hypothetical protein [Gemmatimonadales bacterium]